MLSTRIRDALGEVLPLLGLDPDIFTGRWERVAEAHGWAMANAQLLELAVRMASAASRDDLIDEDAAAVVHADLRRRLGRAISRLGTDWPKDLELPPSLMADLEEARARRNHLAHEFWILNVGRAMTDADAVVAELEGDAARFDALSGQLVDSVYARALSQRGLEVGPFAGFIQFLLTALVWMPDALAEVPLIGDGERLIGRLQELLPDVLARLSGPDDQQSGDIQI